MLGFRLGIGVRQVKADGAQRFGAQGLMGLSFFFGLGF